MGNALHTFLSTRTHRSAIFTRNQVVELRHLRYSQYVFFCSSAISSELSLDWALPIASVFLAVV
jgi:hypothetical protein